jgi:DNA repair exonuclease SbcCD nuclease subunit
MMRGSVTSTGQPLVGMDMELGLEDLALVGADAYALGHIHCAQSWSIDGAPAFYPGSPRRTAFGELERKGFTVVRFTGEHGYCQTTTEFIELAATPMVLLESAWSSVDDDFSTALPLDLHGSEVRFRYRVESDHRETARSAAEHVKRRWLDSGAVSVKLEPQVIAVTRSRAPEVAKATTLEEQLAAYWGSTNYDPGDRRDALMSKLSQLETVQ